MSSFQIQKVIGEIWEEGLDKDGSDFCHNKIVKTKSKICFMEVAHLF